MPLPSTLTETSQAHLEALVTAGESEGQHLDFKSQLPAAWNDKAKHDMLSDASAFANASGGCLLFGMEQDKKGHAAKLVVQSFNPDMDAMQMESILRDGIEPRMPGVQVHPVPVTVDGTSGYVVLVKVPQSWVGPHRVKPTRAFYLRDGRQSRPVDVPELRGLFLQTESQAQRVRDFRTERLSRILSGETPYRLTPGAVLALHLIAPNAAMGLVGIDPTQYLGLRRSIPVLTARDGAVMSLVNLDGAAGSRNPVDKGSNGYTLLFRNGFIEGTWLLGDKEDGGAVLAGGVFEDYVAQFITAVRAELAHWRLPTGQAMAMLSILGADRVTVAVKREYAAAETGTFDRKVLVIPDVDLSGENGLRAELKPLFDLVWQSAGFQGSPHYDEAGRHRPVRS
jgi:hypothetical protein